MTVATTYLRVRNWDKFQYRTDKRLPWIRSHDSQLEDYEYTSLSDAQRGHLHDIRLLANRTKNKIPDDPGWVRAAIRASRAPDLQRLCALGFLEAWVPDTELPANQRVPDAHGAHNGRTQDAGDREGDRDKPPTPLRGKALLRCCAPRTADDGPCISHRFKTEQERAEHLDIVHWLNPQQIEQAIAAGVTATPQPSPVAPPEKTKAGEDA